VIDWVGDRTFEQAWKECNRGDWMLWYAAKANICDHKIVVGLACDCAERALKYIPDGETRPAEAIRITRLWIKGEATIEEVETAAALSACALSSKKEELKIMADMIRDKIKIQEK